MTGSGRDGERIRWRCRRGMLELDLVLKAFTDRHLDTLDGESVAAFSELLERPDPELLDLVMGRAEAENPDEKRVLALIHSSNTLT